MAVNWNEVLRPVRVTQVVGNDRFVEDALVWERTGEYPAALLFVGEPGTGKTSAALAIAHQFNLEAMMINASEERSIDIIRNKMTDFCSAMSIDGRRKMLILDEADHLPDLSQNALRNFFEKFSSNCSFVMTANQAQRIISPLQSRCAVIEFKFPKEEKPRLAGGFYQKICNNFLTEVKYMWQSKS